MRTLGVICARAGSKAYNGKNIAPVNGKPLLAYSIEAARGSERLTRFVVSTDGDDIAEVAKEYGAHVVVRPEGLAQDNSRIELALIHALHYAQVTDAKYDAVLLLQNSSPLRTSHDIDFCISLLEGLWDKTDSVASVYVVKEEHPLKLYNLSDMGYLTPFVEKTEIYRRQDLPRIYRMNGVIYLVKADYLVEHKRVVANRVLPYVMSEYRSVDIHNAMDIPIAEAIMNEQTRLVEGRIGGHEEEF